MTQDVIPPHVRDWLYIDSVRRACAAYQHDPSAEEAQDALYKKRMQEFYDKYPQFKPETV